jgi:diaminopimelate decarboxylase
MIDATAILQKAKKILAKATPLLEDEVLCAYVRSFQEQGGRFLECSQRQGTPVYAFDEKALLERARQFTAAFSEQIEEFRPFFAVKSNNHPAVARSLVELGLGLDVSSGLELEAAFHTGCRDILFTGPGKTNAELDMALNGRDRVTVLIDSFGELDRLEHVAMGHGVSVRAGVRLTTDEKGLWRKFGIPLTTLEQFMERAEGSKYVNLCGLQFHTSWNLAPLAQVSFLRRLGKCMGAMRRKRRDTIQFLDIGGGYWPPLGDWLHFSAVPEGRLAQTVLSHIRSQGHYRFRSERIEVFAREIGKCLRECIFPHARCRVLAEPGRWLVHDCMHILLTVIDKKADDLVITDGGTNIIGWERFETDYFPVINLSRPSLTERRCMILGSLCTPHDVWGYGYFGDGIEPGDVLLIPSQGAYTYSLRQLFIKPLAKVAPLATPEAQIDPGVSDRESLSNSSRSHS